MIPNCFYKILLKQIDNTHDNLTRGKMGLILLFFFTVDFLYYVSIFSIGIYCFLKLTGFYND